MVWLILLIVGTFVLPFYLFFLFKYAEAGRLSGKKAFIEYLRRRRLPPTDTP